MFGKKLLSIVLAVAIAGTTLVGCGKAASKAQNSSDDGNKPVTITFWHTFSDTEKDVFNKKVLPQFKKKYPNITIKAVAMPTNGLKQQVIQGVGGNSGPDVMRMDIVWVPEFAGMGALKDLSGFDGFNDVKSKSYSSCLETATWKGKYYGVPQDTNTKVALYSKAALQEAGLTEAPKTIDDLISAAQKLKDKHKNGLIGVSGTDAWAMSPLFLSLGGKYTDAKYTKAEGYINSTKSVEALQKIVNWNDQGLIGKCVLNGQPGVWDGIKKGDYLMADDGPWFYSILKDVAKQKATAAILPKGEAGSISVVGGEDLVMFNSTKHPQAVWKFMKFMFSKDIQKEMALDADLMPTNKDAANDSQVTSDPVMKIYVEQMKTAWARIPNPKYEEMNDKIQKAFEAALRHKGTPKQLLDQLAKDMDSLFSQSK
mgnify:CR=1 FL=1